MERRRHRGLAIVAACALAFAGSALAGTEPAAATPNLAAVHLALTTVAHSLSDPVAVAWRHGDARMYVAEQTGTVRIVSANGAPLSTPVLSLSVSGGEEQGLLGLTFSADGTKLYVDYTGPNGDIHIVEYTMSGDVANVGSKRELLVIAHNTFPNHNGGEVIFGPDGDLYIGVGDGGGGGDPLGSGQNTDVLLGKILRINPAPSGGLQYTIPADNPFRGQAGKRGEIWMYGLRNPWRFTFDRNDASMWIGDVGQDAYEEVDVAAPGQKGANFGWSLREGFHPYNGGAEPPGAIDPLFETAHSAGNCAIIGGYVYRGSAIANLNGAYVYGDLCRSQLVGVVESGGHVTATRDLGVSVSDLSSFGEDPSGELYALSHDGAVYKLVEDDAVGYWISDAVGHVFGFHGATACPATLSSTPVVGIAGTSAGYWTVAHNGAIVACHVAAHGSLAGQALHRPIVGMATTPTGRGYWLVGSDGGIFTFGDARYFGSTGSWRLHMPIVGMAPTPTGRGYYLVAADGGIFTFGDAVFHGSTGAMQLRRPIVGMAMSGSGRGYWLVASDGGIFTFGDAPFFGSTGGRSVAVLITGMASTPTGRGYWLIGADGHVYVFGDAHDRGAARGALIATGIAHN